MATSESNRLVWYLLKLAGAVVVMLVSAWAVGTNNELQTARKDIVSLREQYKAQYTLLDYKVDLLLRNHGIEVPKEKPDAAR